METREGYVGCLTEQQHEILKEFLSFYANTFEENQVKLKELGNAQSGECAGDVTMLPEAKTVVATPEAEVVDDVQQLKDVYDYSQDLYLYPGLKSSSEIKSFLANVEDGSEVNGTSPGSIARKIVCLRMLRARNFDIEKSKKLFEECMELREKYGYFKVYTEGLSSFSHPGAQVYATSTGLSDYQGKPIAVGRINVLNGSLVQQEPHIT